MYGMTYASPHSGENQQTVQMADLDGDGKQEYLLFAKGGSERPMRVLIFDEVITGFRLSFGGAGEYFGIEPDMVTLGKIVGGGMPLAAYGGTKEIMEVIAPDGPVYQAGTLSGNPIAVTAGLETLRILKAHPEIYKELADERVCSMCGEYCPLKKQRNKE